MDIKQEINKLRTSSGGLNTAILRRDWFIKSETYKEIINRTQFLPSDVNLNERIYNILNDNIAITTCKCGNVVSFISAQRGYSPSCSARQCKQLHKGSWKTAGPKIRDNTILEKQISLEGTVMSKVDIIKILQNRSINIQDNTHWITRKMYRDNQDLLRGILKLTNFIELIDSEYNWSQRIYHILSDNYIMPKCIVCNTNYTRFTNFKKGYAQCCSDRICMNTKSRQSRITSHIETVKRGLESQEFSIIVPDNYEGLNAGRMKIKCNKCNNILDKILYNGQWQNIYCSHCNGLPNSSIEEKQVLAFIITELNISNYIENYNLTTGNSKELDIFISNKNVGIEYNGNLWHSFGTTYPNNANLENKNKHYTKFIKCKDKGIKLLQIWDYEWNSKIKKQIWKSIIRSKLGMTEKIPARKCTIKSISSQNCNDFLNLTHLLGECNSSICLGLYYNNNLVAVMTFSAPRFNSNYQYELIRFSSALNTTVIGGASKLFKHFTKTYNPKDIISYANLRYSDGGLYNKLGFNLMQTSPPSYSYIKGGNITSRYAAQKHKLSKLLEQYDGSITEHQNMFNNGYRRLWDCGNYVFVWKSINIDK